MTTSRIKPTECMLGDLLLRLNGAPTKVESITDEGINIEWDGSEMYGYEATFNEIMPMPLTVDFLIKNGFKKLYQNEKNNMVQIEGAYKEIERDGGYKVTWSDVSSLLYVYTLNVQAKFQTKYVHELQHALRLVGLGEMADNLKI